MRPGRASQFSRQNQGLAEISRFRVPVINVFYKSATFNLQRLLKAQLSSFLKIHEISFGPLAWLRRVEKCNSRGGLDRMQVVAERGEFGTSYTEFLLAEQKLAHEKSFNTICTKKSFNTISFCLLWPVVLGG
jgi:hypothetical protein